MQKYFYHRNKIAKIFLSQKQKQTNYLRDKAWDTNKAIIAADNNGHLSLSLDLSPWACVLIKQL